VRFTKNLIGNSNPGRHGGVARHIRIGGINRGDLAHGRRQGDAGGAQGKAGCGTWGAAHDEAFVHAVSGVIAIAMAMPSFATRKTRESLWASWQPSRHRCRCSGIRTMQTHACGVASVRKLRPRSMSASGRIGRKRIESDFRFCEGFRMPAADGGGTGSGGRRPKASRGRNRDGERMAVPRALWGFGRSG